MSDEGERTCPLCAEEMDLTDQQLKPCKCGYEICVWCWHQILEMAEKENTEGRCPACRAPYDKEKIVGMAANCKRMVAEQMERKKSQKTKTKSSEARKQLSSVRVIQRNLVYIVGLPLNLADEDLLQSKEYFGQYGKVLKVSLSRTAAGVIQQFPNNTCSVYITYSKEEEAIRCIQSVHGFVLDGRSLKACFGTTKYCHAWLRNVPCANPDCLYLHEIGSQEDSFTKDEIVSAFTRNRVQQITGATNNMLRRAGSMLPPPIDDYSCYSAASVPKPIAKNPSNNTITSKSSPPNGTSSRSVALPAAASWGTRAANQPQAACSTSSNGPAIPKSDATNGTLPFSSVVANSTHASAIEMEKRTTWNYDGLNGTIKPDPLKSVKQNVDSQANELDKTDTTSDTDDITSSNQSSSPPSSKNDDWASDLVSNSTDSFVHIAPSSEKGGITAADLGSTKINNNFRSEVSGLTRTSSSFTDCGPIKLPGSPGLQQSNADQYGEPLSSPETDKNSDPGDQSDWRKDPPIQTAKSFVSAVEEDIISFDNQRLKDPEVISHATSYLPNSVNSLHLSHHSRSHSLHQNEPFAAVAVNADPLFVDNRVGDQMRLNMSNITAVANGYPEKVISGPTILNRNIEHSFHLRSDGERKHIGRLHGEVTALDVGENNIISNILSLDLDSMDDSLTSPQHLAELLGEADKQPTSLNMSSSWKLQNNHQSRFSFARQEASRNPEDDSDTSFNVFGQLQRNFPFGQDYTESKLSYVDKLGMGNNLSSNNFDESETFFNGPSILPARKPSAVSRSQISAPPGFSVPNRAPPPGFSSSERIDHIFDTIPGSHMLDSSSLPRASYQAPPTGGFSSSGDVEFIDPAILAVGKGRIQGGLNNNQGLDMRSNFPHQLSPFESEARLQLLMQRSLSSHQNMRYTDMGDGFSALSDSYGISSRFVDQSQLSNLRTFMQMSLQHSRNGLISNGLWDGWNEAQGGNNLDVAELLRNGRLGLNKYYNAGYEDSKFQMPNSGDFYNRSFEM